METQNELQFKRKSAENKHDIYFRQFALGCGQVILMGLCGDRISMPERTRQFPNSGELFSHFMYFVGNWAPKWCQEHSHEQKGVLNEDVVYNRYHKMYYDNGEKNRLQRSDEHYNADLKLRRWVNNVEELFKRGQPISEEEMLTAMEGWK